MAFNVKCDRVVAERFGNEIVIVHIQKGTYYSLLGCGVDIWAMIEAGCSPETIRNVPSSKEGAPEAARSEIEAVIDTLCNEDLIEAAGGGGIESFELEASPYDSPRVEIYTDLQNMIALDPSVKLT